MKGELTEVQKLSREISDKNTEISSLESKIEELEQELRYSAYAMQFLGIELAKRFPKFVRRGSVF